MEQVTTVSTQVDTERSQNGSAPQIESGNGSSGGHWRDGGEAYRTRTLNRSYIYSSSTSSPFSSGPLYFLGTRDPRVEVLVECFLFWMDTTEMVRAAEVPAVFYSNWVFPVYIMAYISTLRLVLTPGSPLLLFSGVVLQDLPFLVVRICLVAVFGYVTPLLYIMKNILVCLSFIYFIFMTKLRVFNRTSLFWGLWTPSDFWMDRSHRCREYLMYLAVNWLRYQPSGNKSYCSNCISTKYWFIKNHLLFFAMTSLLSCIGWTLMYSKQAYCNTDIKCCRTKLW